MAVAGGEVRGPDRLGARGLLPALAFLGPPSLWIGVLFILPMATIVLLRTAAMGP